MPGIETVGKPRTTDLRAWLWGNALRGSEHSSPHLRTGLSVVRGKAMWLFKVTLLFLICLQSPFPPAEAAPIRLTIGHGAMSSSTVPLWVTKEQGFFAKHGIDAELVAFFRGAPTVIASLVSGEIQISYLGASSVIGAASQGIELKIVGSLFDRLTHDLIAVPSIKSAEDLRGKRFGIQSFGGGVWIQTMLGLEHLGLEPKRDKITLLVVGDSVRIAQALEVGGVVDAAVLDRALTGRLRQKGFSVVAEFYKTNIPLSRIGLVVSQAYLHAHSEALQRVVSALVEGIAFGLAPGNKPVVIKTMMKNLRVSDPAVAEQAYNDILLAINRKPYPSIEGVRNMQRLMALYNPKVAALRSEDLIDARFVRRLDESGFIDQLYGKTR